MLLLCVTRKGNHGRIKNSISDSDGYMAFFKKYGVKRLGEDKWDELYRDGERLLKKYRAVNPDMGQLFEDMYIALRKYYQRRETADEI